MNRVASMRQVLNSSHLSMSTKVTDWTLERYGVKNDKSEGVTVQREREFRWFVERFTYVHWHLTERRLIDRGSNSRRNSMMRVTRRSWERDGADRDWDVSSDVVTIFFEHTVVYSSQMDWLRSNSFSLVHWPSSCLEWTQSWKVHSFHLVTSVEVSPSSSRLRHIYTHWHTPSWTKNQVSTYKIR